MSRILKKKTFVLVLIGTIVITGCASAPAVKEMIPSVHFPKIKSVDKTLKVAEVTGGEKTNQMGASKIENEGFRDALLSTLQESGLFKVVFADQSGDYELLAKIISQELKPGLTINSILFVNYRLIETKSNKEVWKENILSQYDAKFKEAYYGIERAKKANEGAVRDNLTQLLGKLSKVLNQL